MCGENFCGLFCGITVDGSPPRVRGKQDYSFDNPILGRITPACAGKTEKSVESEKPLSDHPRVCGENLDEKLDGLQCVGSPPRVRGKRPDESARRRELRITPACAGKTTTFFRFWLTTTDHPRVCGENHFFAAFVGYGLGSPPRVRGKPVYQRVDSVSGRITPACAGKTTPSCTPACAGSDHPRVCGENALPTKTRIWGSGSPPRVRGKQSCSFVWKNA